MADRIIQPEQNEDERLLDRGLRPAGFDEFVGQDRIKQNLQVFIDAARNRGGGA